MTAAALSVALAAVFGCAKPQAPRAFTVTLANMGYGALPPSLRAGDTITWINRDMFEHTATARNGAFDVDLKPGDQAVTVLKQAGTIAFYCRFHPNMAGELVVGR